MRRLEVVPIEFKQSPAGLVPRHPDLYSRVVQYCEENLAEQPDLLDYAKSWAVVEFGGKEEIIDIHGITFYCMRPDIAGFRVTGENAKRATKMLQERLNAHFADNGWRGHEVFLYISDKEKPEQRCEAWQESLESVGSKPAERFLVKVR